MHTPNASPGSLATVLAAILLPLALAGCEFDTSLLDEGRCEATVDCAGGHVCVDGFCVPPSLDAFVDLDPDAPDLDRPDTTDSDLDVPTEDADLTADATDATDQITPPDTMPPLLAALTVFDAELVPAVVPPDVERVTTLALRVQRGTRGGTNLLLVRVPQGIEADVAGATLSTFEGVALEATAALDGNELRFQLGSVLPDGRYRIDLPVTIAADAPDTLAWTLRAAPVDPEREGWVDARADDVDPDAGASTLTQAVRRLFAGGVAELVPVGPGFSPKVFVASSTLDTSGLYDDGAPGGTLHLVLDDVSEPGLDRLALDLVPAVAAAPDLVLDAVRVEGAVRHLVDAPPSPLQARAVPGTTPGEPTLSLELGAPMLDTDGDGTLRIELDLRLESSVAASGFFALRAWDSAVPDIVREIPAGDATASDGRNTLDYEVWAWVQRYGYDFSSEADHNLLTDGAFDGWTAFAEGNGRARIASGRLAVDNYVYEASGTTVVYHGVPDYTAPHPLRVVADLSVSMNDNLATNSPNGTSFYFGAFAEAAELTSVNGTNDTTPAAGYGAWIFSGRHNGSIQVSGHWGIVDSVPTSHRSDVLAGSDIAQPTTHLDWSATTANVRELIATWGSGGALDIWLTPDGEQPTPTPTLTYRPANAGGSGPVPVHAANGNVFFEMTDEGVAAITRVRFDELVPP